MEKEETKKPEENTYTKIQTKEEVEEEIIDLQEHPHFKLALQVSDGNKRLEKYNKLVGLLSEREKKEKKTEK